MNVRINAMEDMARDEKDEYSLLYEIPDHVLEAAACIGNERASTFTQWVCTALYFCPGP